MKQQPGMRIHTKWIRFFHHNRGFIFLVKKSYEQIRDFLVSDALRITGYYVNVVCLCEGQVVNCAAQPDRSGGCEGKESKKQEGMITEAKPTKETEIRVVIGQPVELTSELYPSILYRCTP